MHARNRNQRGTAKVFVEAFIWSQLWRNKKLKSYFYPYLYSAGNANNGVLRFGQSHLQSKYRYYSWSIE
jgi:hypothetical protein